MNGGSEAFDWQALDDWNARPVPLFTVEPPDNGGDSEQTRQQKLVAALNKRGRGVVVFSVPNEGRNTDWERTTRWRAGARRGAPDLIVAWNRGVAFIEMKGGKTEIKDAQVETLNALYRAGHHVAIWRDPAKAIDWLRSLGCPVREVR